MKKRILKASLGLVVGGALGYAYFAYVGCSSGGCPITSSPVVSTVYGAVVGLVLTGL